MAIVTTDDKHYKDIANKIRDFAGTSKTYTPEEMANGVGEVYDATYAYAHESGYQEGIRIGFEDGKSKGIAEGAKAQYDRFWTALTTNLPRYYHTFRYWTDEMFNVNAIIKSTQFNYTFANSQLTRIGTIDASEATTFATVFQESYSLKTIDKLILPNNFNGNGVEWNFNYCSALENISFEGEFKNNGWNFQWSKKLSHDSIVNIINALSTTTSGLTVTLSKAAVNKAFEQLEGANDGANGVEWYDLIDTRSNWTISLV